jgi:hypothetical protein
MPFSLSWIPAKVAHTREACNEDVRSPSGARHRDGVGADGGRDDRDAAVSEKSGAAIFMACGGTATSSIDQFGGAGRMDPM